MRKSLIVSAVIAVSTLFAGLASADETSRGAERPSIQNARSGRSVDAAARTATKIREYRERTTTRETRESKQVERKLDRARPKGDMVEDKGRVSKAAPQASRTTAQKGNVDKLLGGKIARRGDVQNDNGRTRAFTLANDRKGTKEHSGPRTIVDVMKRKELFKFLGAAGVKINCSQTGTCVEETTM